MNDNNPPTLFASMFPEWRKIVFALLFGFEKTAEMLWALIWMLFGVIIVVLGIKVLYWALFIWKI